VRIVALVVLLCARVAFAQEPCDPQEAAELRAHLEKTQRRAGHWNFAWRLTFTGAAVGTLAVGLANPFPELRDGLYVSSGKATIGALARWILPLRVRVPAANSDVCADVAALRKEITRVAKKQRELFFVGHAGGILVNGAGAAIIYYRSGLGQALLSVAIGYPIGLLSNYTMPRSTWQLWRERNWTVTVTPTAHAWLVGISGEL